MFSHGSWILTTTFVVFVMSPEASGAEETNRTRYLLPSHCDKTEAELNRTWFFTFDCPIDQLEACTNSNFEGLCSQDTGASRPAFNLTNGRKTFCVVGSASFDFGVFKFSTDNDFVGGIFAVGILICVAMVIYLGFTVAKNDPELAKALIDGCVMCRTGEKPKREVRGEIEMRSQGKKSTE